jgi:hypothetical protein
MIEILDRSAHRDSGRSITLGRNGSKELAFARWQIFGRLCGFCTVRHICNARPAADLKQLFGAQNWAKAPISRDFPQKFAANLVRCMARFRSLSMELGRRCIQAMTVSFQH